MAAERRAAAPAGRAPRRAGVCAPRSPPRAPRRPPRGRGAPGARPGRQRRRGGRTDHGPRARAARPGAEDPALASPALSARPRRPGRPAGGARRPPGAEGATAAEQTGAAAGGLRGPGAMGKCSGRCTLVAFCCLQLVSGVGAAGGVPGPRVGAGPWVCVRGECPGGGWSGVTERTGGASPCWPRCLFVCAPRRRAPGRECAPRPGLRAPGLLLRGALWDWSPQAGRGWGCGRGWCVDPWLPLPCVCLDHSFVCVGLPSLWAAASGLRPGSVSHKVSAPVRVCLWVPLGHL